MASADNVITRNYQTHSKIKSDENSNYKAQCDTDNSLESLNYRHLNRSNIIVTIPAFNEEVAIGSVVARCKKYVDTVIVVDDGSKDHTAEVARLVGANVVSHEKNSGYGAAIKTCFEVAKKRDVEAMIIIDADGQHDPDSIPDLIDKMVTDHSDIVIGSRFVNGNGRSQDIPAYRKVGMLVLDNATELGSGQRITDSQSGYRLYSKNAIQKIVLDNNGMAAGSEILIQAADKKLKISEVPIIVRYDIEKTSSKNPVVHGMDVLSNIIRLISQKHPLVFFGVPGVVLLIIGIICGIQALNLFYGIGYVSLFYTAMCMICILLATFSMFTGVILRSIQSTIRELKT